MAFRQGLTPFSWHPTAQSPVPGLPGTPISGAAGGYVDAGDWRMVSLSYRQSNNRPVGFMPGFFLVHVLFTPDSDDSTKHEDMSVTFGGTVANRKRTYHIDPGVWFQAPSRGTLSIIAGGESDDSVILDVVVSAILSPRDTVLLRAQEAEMIAAAAAEANSGFLASGVPLDFEDGVIPSLFENNNVSALAAMAGMNPAMQPTPPRKYAPPVVGTPQRVPATWISIPIATPIQFPDGAELMFAGFQAAAVITPIRILINTLGNAGLPIDLVPGVPGYLGALAQGFACSDGVPATWTTAVALPTVTILSSLGG